MKLLVFIAGLSCTAGLFFRLNPKQPECFALPSIAVDGTITGSFEAVAKHEGMTTKLTNLGKTIWQSTQPSAKFAVNVTAEDSAPGICFESNSKNSQTVSFSVAVRNNTEWDNHDDTNVATEKHTAKVSDLVTRLKWKVADIMDQQQYAITREHVHRSIAESTNSGVQWWAIAQVLCNTLLALVQIYYLRSYFEVKQIV